MVIVHALMCPASMYCIDVEVMDNVYVYFKPLCLLFDYHHVAIELGKYKSQVKLFGCSGKVLGFTGEVLDEVVTIAFDALRCFYNFTSMLL